MNTTLATVKVSVVGKLSTYPLLAGEFGDHLSEGGKVGSLAGFLAECHANLKANEWVKSITGWVTLDESGLAYRIRVTGRRSYSIDGASPINGELPEVYYA
jgi:hypothetical protein